MYEKQRVDHEIQGREGRVRRLKEPKRLLLLGHDFLGRGILHSYFGRHLLTANIL
jgi:hypothetical protein